LGAAGIGIDTLTTVLSAGAVNIKHFDGGKDRKEITMKKRQGVFFGFAVLLITAIFTLAGCNTGGGGDDDIWLADLSNPFIGKWESHIPSMNNARMISEYKTDGTFTCGFPEVEGYEGPFNGGYLVSGNVIVTYTDFEGVAGFTFKVVDNDTIDVTEFEVKEDGSFESGNTAPFTRFAGSTVNKENKPFVLNHPYLGKWRFDDDIVLPPDTSSVHYTILSDMSADGILRFDYEMTGYPPDSKSTPYFIYDNKLVVYSEKDGVEMSEFTPDNAEEPNTITFTEEYGGAIFTRVSD
jgi:predicted small secreted protein